MALTIFCHSLQMLSACSTISTAIMISLVDFILPQNLRPYVKSNKKLDIQKNPLNETVLLSTQNIRKKYGYENIYNFTLKIFVYLNMLSLFV